MAKNEWSTFGTVASIAGVVGGAAGLTAAFGASRWMTGPAPTVTQIRDAIQPYLEENVEGAVGRFLEANRDRFRGDDGKAASAIEVAHHLRKTGAIVGPTDEQVRDAVIKFMDANHRDGQGPQELPPNVPLGTILAWHKNPTATPDGKNPGPSLELNEPGSPVRWMECNGQTITRGSYPEFFQMASFPSDIWNVPKLNLSDGYDGGKFLRGGKSSGKSQKGTLTDGRSFTDTDATDDDAFPAGHSLTASLQDAAYRIRPTNMSVVWIIRVK